MAITLVTECFHSLFTKKLLSLHNSRTYLERTSNRLEDVMGCSGQLCLRSETVDFLTSSLKETGIFCSQGKDNSVIF